ncbi:MAG: hypothetical protein ACXVDD_20105 [Polyangia bacterium]
MNEEEEEKRLTAEERAAFGAAEPPAGFAERVVGAWQKERAAAAATARPRRRGLSLAVGGLTLAAAAVMLLWLRPPPSPTGGERAGDHQVGERTTFHVGGRATAVAEAGSALSWRVTPGGEARVQQSAGDVFYRVEKGGPFVVSTAAGDVTVLGTCFRVEVQPMDKKAAMAAGVGALAATMILVSVYEGRVLLANERGRTELAAGERGTAQGAGAPARLAAEMAKSVARIAAQLPPPAAGATREELLKRDADQREELARLRAEVQAMESRAVEPFDRKAGDAYFNPPKDELLQMAKECKLKWDAPPLSLTPETMSDKLAQESGVSDEERRQFNRVTAEFDQRMIAQLRALYVEVTGDKAGADSLTPQAMETEIRSKVPDAMAQEAYWRLSHERAGLIAPSTDTHTASPMERFLRLETSAGDSYERELGAAIGPARAHALRAGNGGWGSRWVSGSDCPPGR